MKKFPFYKQPDQMDCGPTCLRMLSKYYGKNIQLSILRNLSETTREGSSLRHIANAAEKIGFKTLGVKTNFEKLKNDAPLPCIVHWEQSHFVIVYKIKKETVFVADPAHGLLQYKSDEFIKHWIGNGATKTTEDGITLLVEVTPKLKEFEEDKDTVSSTGFLFLFRYLSTYKSYLIQLVIGLLAGSVLQLIFPFLTQSIVDIGIHNQDIHFIYLILIAQLFLFIGKIGIEFIRSWILLHLSTRINISLVSDFFIKLMNLPISFFDTKMTGDIMQRINDHQRIERLLTTTSLSVLFSMFNLFIFGGVLAWYSTSIFSIFCVGSILYFIWVLLFLKKRKDLDYKRFAHMGDEQSKIMELINGMQEIKLYNAERQKRWSWEYLQARLFKIEVKNLALEQTQNIGSNFINEFKNILITIFSAKLVIDGEITLGMMLSISYIIGQLNSPILKIIGFIHSAQDAKIALDRLSEIHNKKNEEDASLQKSFYLPQNKNLLIKNIHFKYNGSFEEVIRGITLTIPQNKVTAIVGASGSGKTTLMKLLLRFYEPSQGEICIGNQQVHTISHETWRTHSGVVMQDGYIFNDTIANNIAIGEDIIDKNKLNKAAKIANIKEFIDTLPLGFNTKIGMEGLGISGGQKQRLFIARAVYKNPEFIFFDEATSALDANNEKIIMQNLDVFFKERTAVVIAHRLSTVKNADQIIVLDNGKIIEHGNHEFLVSQKGSYYHLVKNQLELELLNT